MDVHDDSSIILREDLMVGGASNLGGGTGIASGHGRAGSDIGLTATGVHTHQAAHYESILFYDEPIAEDSYDYDMIDELFLNPKRKLIKVSKDRSGV